MDNKSLILHYIKDRVNLLKSILRYVTVFEYTFSMISYSTYAYLKNLFTNP